MLIITLNLHFQGAGDDVVHIVVFVFGEAATEEDIRFLACAVGDGGSEQACAHYEINIRFHAIWVDVVSVLLMLSFRQGLGILSETTR